ncbi:hypothetical protein F441_23112 [Phytophthora nicotianae CJ01A1]|uniref:DDE Tnp4 domain-containing protein n=2 Tax=Phytophthora nicotianae TaxID=4792 RepID=W2VMI5_PHYNI|nr:hypothetical protein F441_23112 [Phytophthora nicotianae CJ01A1]
MPRTSKRKRALRLLRRAVRSRRKVSALRFMLGCTNDFEDDVDEQFELQLQQIASSRYAFRSNRYRKRDDKWKSYLDEDGDLNDEEFLGHFLVSRIAFAAVLDLIRDDTAFKPSDRRSFRGGAKVPSRTTFERTCSAILRLRDITVTWPGDEEESLITRRIQDKYGFVNCVGLVDGTLLPLEFKPRTNGEDYFSRKGGYCLNALIICDDVARVRDAVVGWHGSVHDSRVWMTSKVCRSPESFFDPKQYILGDSAFQASSIMVPAHKKPPKADLDIHKKYFNTQLAKVRIKTEHCIGLIKTRFQYMRGIRIKITGKRSMKRLLRIVACVFILHNLLIYEPIPKEWEEEVTIYGNGLREADEQNQPLCRNTGGCERREQLFYYLLEVRGANRE